MSKSLFIAEKPSVAREFANALKQDMKSHDGYLESSQSVVTWCVGHLVTMSYPEAYDPAMKRWTMDTLPFLPSEFRYEIIPGVSKQFKIVSGLLNRKDVDTIYICTDSGREGEYIYRLVDQMAWVKDKTRKRVWIDSQTEEEILRGIREAKDWSAYDNLSASAYLRAKEDYLMGINFSRLLTLKYGNTLAGLLQTRYAVISVGRVMTCVLGMVVRREREIRSFVKTPFYRIVASLDLGEASVEEGETKHFPEAEWRAVEGSRYAQSPKLYKENGFLKEEDAKELLAILKEARPQELVVTSLEKKKESKNPPLLYNLAELQNDCSKLFKISPDETLKVVQTLYERKLVTYPRTDARVLSTAVAKEIQRNISGLCGLPGVAAFAKEILEQKAYQGIEKTRYVNDKQITDHYAIIPTGQGLGALKGMPATYVSVYEIIVRRFLAIFYPAAQYQKINLVGELEKEFFFSSSKVLVSNGYLKVMEYSFLKKKSEEQMAPELLQKMASLKKGDRIPIAALEIKEGETTPPKRYNSGSLILAMENAGQLIEDEELRAQIKGSGIGTSATRAEILKKLVNNRYLALEKKNQIVTPTLQGELIFDAVASSITSLLNPELTASWEKGLTYVAEGTITPQEYMDKLTHFIVSRTRGVQGLQNQAVLQNSYKAIEPFYQKETRYRKSGKKE